MQFSILTIALEKVNTGILQSTNKFGTTVSQQHYYTDQPVKTVVSVTRGTILKVPTFLESMIL